MGDDAFAFGKTDGMASATNVNCTAEDIEVATAVVSSYSFDLAGTFTPLLPGQRIQCDPATQPVVFINTVANLRNNAQSRYDIGVWIESDPNNPVVQFTQGSSTAVTGSCTHYNLTTISTGVSQLDGDACGDMSQGSGLAELDLDILAVPCQDDNGDGVVEIGACIAWQNVVGDASRVCPSPGNEESFRFGTTPNNKAKCNCDPMVLPIDIAASLDIEKQSIGGTGEFDFTVVGSGLSPFTRNTATQGNPTATNPVILGAANYGDKYVTETAEPGFTLTAINCTPNGAVIAIGTGQGGAFSEGATAGFDAGDNTVKVTVGAGDSPTCTFVNTKDASIDIEKESVGGTAEFDYTVSGAPLAAFTRNTGTANPTANTPVVVTAANFGDKYITESPETGFTLTAINCTDNGAVIVYGTGQGGSFAQGATAGFDAGDNTVKITVDAGDTPTCTFVNTNGGSLDIEKQSVGGTGEFDFTVAGSGLSPFTRNTATQGNPTATNAVIIGPADFGEKYVSETAEPGYTLTAINCTANGAVITIGTGQGGTFAQGATTGFDPGDNTVKVDVGAGDNPTCTFVNTKDASIDIEKQSVGGTAEFDYTVSGAPLAAFTRNTGTANPTATNPVAVTAANFGDKYVTESAETGYTLTAINCTANGAVIVIGTGQNGAFSPGTSAGFDPGDNTVKITVDAGDTPTCTFVNTGQAQLRIKKVTDPAGLTQSFTFTPGNYGSGTFNLTDGQTNNSGLLIPGTYTATETVPTGWSLTNRACVLTGTSTTKTFTPITNGVSVALLAGEDVTCTFTNVPVPNLSIVKEPDAGDAGSPLSVVNPGDDAVFEITVSNAATAGPALGVVVTDTLPAGLTWSVVSETPNLGVCTIFTYLSEARRLVCTVGTLNGNSSFKVVVKATLPLNWLQVPPGAGDLGERLQVGDGNLDDDGAGVDWNNAGIVCATGTGCKLDLPTGSGDDSFGNGTKEDTQVPSVVDGSIPNNKSDLSRFYVQPRRIEVSAGVLHDFVYLAWERVQAPTGTTNMDFELNQSATPSANGITPVRTAGDVLIKYDLGQGGDNLEMGFHRWVTAASAGGQTAAQVCEASNKFPCWDKEHPLSPPAFEASANSGSVDDDIAPDAPRSLDALTFGEAGVDFQAAGIFPVGSCLSFKRAYLKSRSSDSFTAAIKDFIAPLPVDITNCVPRPLINTAWVEATNFQPPISDGGRIDVVEEGTASGFVPPAPTNPRLARREVAPIRAANVVGGEFLAARRDDWTRRRTV
jgi:uncharacterized repeat protein (TIGR01451 family)